MTALVRHARYSDAEAICTLLHTKMNPRIPLRRWFRLFDYPWLSDKPDFGYVVESEGQVLGYCGMVYADRTVGQTDKGPIIRRVVSMSSWYLDKSLRGQGLGETMLVACTRDDSLSLATLTNSAKPFPIQEKVGFRVLEDHRFRWYRKDTADPALRLTLDRRIIREMLDPLQQTILDDMQDQPLMPVLFELDQQQTLLLFSVKRKGESVLWYDLMYASDYAHFSSAVQLLADVLLEEPSAVLAADGRFATKVTTDAQRDTLPVPRMFHSSCLEPAQIDNIYSELQLLDLKLD